MRDLLRRLLRHPRAGDLDLDDPRTTVLRRDIIRSKGLLRRIYGDWYAWIATSLPATATPVLELGSGAGFLHEHVDGLVTSEVFACPFVRVVLDGRALPFPDRSLRAVVMVDVFHHIPDAGAFLEEALRCLEPGGRVLMVEPWVTPWSRCVYTGLHHEPFDPGAAEWSFPATGPLSGANSALPWIVFERDRSLFARRFPGLVLEGITVGMPFSYLLSGGVSLRSLAPGIAWGALHAVESLEPMQRQGMFAKIALRRV